MKGICEKCQCGVVAVAGATVYCPHNAAGGIFLSVFGLSAWLVYSPFTSENFAAAVVAIKAAAPRLESEISEFKKNIKSVTND